MTGPQLFADTRTVKPRWTGSQALVRFEPGCPECHTPLLRVVTAQPALFVHGGYGATVESTWETCLACRWSIRKDQTEIRPDPTTARLGR